MSYDRFAPGTGYVDVEYQGVPRLIATGVLETGDGLLLVDPGPAVSLDGLRRNLEAAGFAFGDVAGLLLTHIHLDHAGATGTLVKAHPGLRVYVHEIGARHLIDPARLLASARRIYGDAMETLWGEVLPVPEASVVRLRGGEALSPGGRTLRVAYTPGHAVHHVSYLDEASGTVFAGDVAGMRVTGDPVVVPVTPPPDVSLEAWQASLDVLRRWHPERLFVTHFGPSEDVAWHLDTLAGQLAAWAERVRHTLDAAGDDAARATVFEKTVLDELRATLPPGRRRLYEIFAQPAGSWYGLARYWRKRG
ncbi:MAG: MBL fold metallo-hydrolase [Rhodothermaceae bacterium]|nr:MAG: MBL fold metallo-hydrolase [Rhodothermaceae bacterium]